VKAWAYAGAAALAVLVSFYVTYVSARPIPLSPRDAGSDSMAALSSGPNHTEVASAPPANPNPGSGLGSSIGVLGDGGTLAFSELMPADGGPLEPTTTASNTVGTQKAVHVGIVLVTFNGAQGASEKARTKTSAQELAQKLLFEAKTDFHAAVSHGDPGSSDDVGRIQRGVLEASTESLLFALPAGSVSEVVETPRGFWIARRID
jgi:hypothetical protein